MAVRKKKETPRLVEPAISDLEVAKKMLKIHQSAVDRKLDYNLSFDTVRKLMSYKTCYYTGKEFEQDGLVQLVKKHDTWIEKQKYMWAKIYGGILVGTTILTYIMNYLIKTIK